MGFKLGNNNYAGGATISGSMKQAFLYADKISKERKEPCIINLVLELVPRLKHIQTWKNFLRN